MCQNAEIPSWQNIKPTAGILPSQCTAENSPDKTC